MPVASTNALVVTTPSDREIVLTRVFNAPARLVFEAWTKPEHVAHWWGCPDSTLSVCEMDVRVGGAWRFVVEMGGKPYTFKGVYREITPPGRLVYTECFDDPSIGSPEWLNTITFEERHGKTTMRSTCLHASVEARNGHLQSGMEEGAGKTLDRLAELIETMK